MGIRQTEKGTWIDEDGEYADPGTEFVFDPRNYDPKSVPEPTTQKSDDAGTEDESEESEETQASLTSNEGEQPAVADDTDDSDEEEEFLLKDGELV